MPDRSPCKLSDEQIEAIAMRCCGDLRADRLCMTRDQRINFARAVLSAASGESDGHLPPGEANCMSRWPFPTGAAASGEPASGWKPIETAPVGQEFLACIEVTNIASRKKWWEQHVLYRDDEDGSIGPDHHKGWDLEDYTGWQPLPPPPSASAAVRDQAPAERGTQPNRWPAGLLERVKAAEQRVQDNRAPRSIPADPHGDVDLVLAEVRYLIEGTWPPFWIKDAAAAPSPLGEAPAAHITSLLVAHRDLIEAQERGDQQAEVDAAARMQTHREALASGGEAGKEQTESVAPVEAQSSEPAGDVVVTWAGDEIVLVSRQDEEGRILSVIAEKGKSPAGVGIPLTDQGEK